MNLRLIVAGVLFAFCCGGLQADDSVKPEVVSEATKSTTAKQNELMERVVVHALVYLGLYLYCDIYMQDEKSIMDKPSTFWNDFRKALKSVSMKTIGGVKEFKIKEEKEAVMTGVGTYLPKKVIKLDFAKSIIEIAVPTYLFKSFIEQDIKDVWAYLKTIKNPLTSESAAA